MSSEPAAAEEEDAVEALRRAVAERPDDVQALTRLGVLLADRGEWEEALEALDRAHYLRPSNAQVLFNYGLALERAGRIREARRRYQAALRLLPDYERVRQRLAALPEESETPRAPRPEADGRRAHAQAPARPAPEPPGPPRREAPSRPAAPTVPPAVEPQAEALTGDPLPAVDLLPPPPVSPDWEPEELPGFVSLGRTILMLWLAQPLVWPAMLAAPAVVAAFLAPAGVPWVAALVWLLALAVGTGPLVDSMVRQLLHEEPFAGGPDPLSRRWGRPGLLAAAALMLSTGPFCVLLGLRVPWEGWVVLLIVLVLTLPFHLVLAPALLLCSVHRHSPVKALSEAFRTAGSRLWMQLAVMVALAVGCGALLSVMSVAAAESTRGLGFPVIRTLETGAVCLAGSLWAAGLAVCGLDTLASASVDRPTGA